MRLSLPKPWLTLPMKPQPPASTRSNHVYVIGAARYTAHPAPLLICLFDNQLGRLKSS